jgi:hypothetical protein
MPIKEIGSELLTLFAQIVQVAESWDGNHPEPSELIHLPVSLQGISRMHLKQINLVQYPKIWSLVSVCTDWNFWLVDGGYQNYKALHDALESELELLK